MPAAANRYPQRILACEGDCRHHVRWVCALGNQPRFAADHGVVYLAGVVVTSIFRSQDLAAELTAKVIICFRFQHSITLPSYPFRERSKNPSASVRRKNIACSSIAILI